MSDRNLVRFLADVTVSASQLARVTVVRFCFSCCTVFVILWIAVMMYVSFYYAYIPTVRHVRPVFLLFNSGCESQGGLCSFPEANLSLSTGERMLMRGQQYQVFLDLEMPYSPVNEKLGMFMVKLSLLSDSGNILATSERSCMLHYQSALLQSFATVFYSLPMVLGFSEEKQSVRISMFEEYVEDSYHPAVGVYVIVMSRHIEIYSAALRIEAQFSGLRYIMINWPATSALIAITVNFLIISVVFFFAYSAFSPVPVFEDDAQPADLDTVTEEQQRALSIRRTGRRAETGTEPLSPRSRRASSSRLTPKQKSASRHKARANQSGGMLRCATFPSCRWDDAKGALSSSVYQAPCSIHRGGPRYYSTDVLGGSQSCACRCGLGDVECDEGRDGFEDLLPAADSVVDTDAYRVLTFPDRKGPRSAGRPFANGFVVTTGERSPSRSRSGDEEIQVVKRSAGGLRYRSHRKKVFSTGDTSSLSSAECIHPRINRRHRRAPLNSCGKSSDSDELHTSDCEYRAISREYHARNDRQCHQSNECKECGELAMDGPLKSRVPDGATSSSEALQNWAPKVHVGCVEEVDSGPLSTEEKTTRALSDTDEGVVKTKKRSTHKTKSRFGLSFKKILSKKDDKLTA